MTNDFYPSGATTDDLERMAAALGVRIRHIEGLPKWGFYDHETRTVLLLAGLAGVQKRCTLAHELAHAILSHSDGRPDWERDAAVLAARLIIMPTDWETIGPIWEACKDTEPIQVGYKCRVTPSLAEAYADHIAPSG